MLVCVALLVAVSAPAATARTPAPCTGKLYRVTHRQPERARVFHSKALIRCVFRHVGIAGEIETALAVADRESGFYPWARNPYSGAAGVYQHLPRYWPGRVHAFLRGLGFPHFPRISPTNDRASIFAAAFMVRGSGWGAWTTYRG